MTLSHRNRRRLGWLAGLAASSAVAFAAVLAFPAPKKIPDVVSKGSPQVVAVEKSVPLPAADRKAINALMDEFVPAAVERRDPLAAYELATPGMQRSATRAEWKRGDIPVYPFDARGTHFDGWTLNFSFPGHVNMDLLVQPDPGEETGPIAFTVDLKRIRGRWLVDSFFPTAVFPMHGSGGLIVAQPDLAAAAEMDGSSRGLQSRISHAWFLVPVVMMIGVLLIPLGVFLVSWRHDRVMRRAYAAGSASLPPLHRRDA